MNLGFLNLGGGEMMIIGLVALLMFGGRLPDVARSLGKSVNQFKKGLKEVGDDVEDDPPAPSALPKSQPSKALAPESIRTASNETAGQLPKS